MAASAGGRQETIDRFWPIGSYEGLKRKTSEETPELWWAFIGDCNTARDPKDFPNLLIDGDVPTEGELRELNNKVFDAVWSALALVGVGMKYTYELEIACNGNKGKVCYSDSCAVSTKVRPDGSAEG